MYSIDITIMHVNLAIKNLFIRERLKGEKNFQNPPSALL